MSSTMLILRPIPIGPSPLECRCTISGRLNEKYLWFDKISISQWCCKVTHECQILFNYFDFLFYLFVHLIFCSILYSINFFSFIFWQIIIKFFKKNSDIPFELHLL